MTQTNQEDEILLLIIKEELTNINNNLDYKIVAKYSDNLKTLLIKLRHKKIDLCNLYVNYYNNGTIVINCFTYLHEFAFNDPDFVINLRQMFQDNLKNILKQRGIE